MNQSMTNQPQGKRGLILARIGLAVLLVVGVSVLALGAVLKSRPQIIGAASSDSALTATLATLHNSSLQPAERIQAARWLGGRNDNSSNLLQSMSRSLHDDNDPTVRATVANALGDVATRSKNNPSGTASLRSPDPQILEILESAYNAEKNASVRRAIVDAVATLDCPEASNFITRAAADTDPSVQEAARDARLKRDQRMRARMLG